MKDENKIIKLNHRKKRGNLKKKIMLLLIGGLALGLSRSPRQQSKIINEIYNEFTGTKKANIQRTIKILRGQGLLKEELDANGKLQIILSERGKKVAERFCLEDIIIKKPKDWDGNWRIIIFDIPEPMKKIRDLIRFHIKRLGFFELQKSVFVFPFPSVNEIDQIVRFYNVRKYVRSIIANSIDNEDTLMKHFNLE